MTSDITDPVHVDRISMPSLLPRLNLPNSSLWTVRCQGYVDAYAAGLDMDNYVYSIPRHKHIVVSSIISAELSVLDEDIRELGIQQTVDEGSSDYEMAESF